MAVDVNSVYQTVLTILNKEQRGYMTPFEFNKIATQVQREIFERYFEDLAQQARVTHTEIDYADRLAEIEKKIEYFRTSTLPTYNVSGDYFEIPINLYRLNEVTYRPSQTYTTWTPLTAAISYNNDYIEAQPVTRHEFNLLRRSTLAAPTKEYPVYLYEENKIKTTPQLATTLGETPIEISYLKKPEDPVWAYTVGTLGEFNYAPAGTSGTVIPSTGSVDFELDNSEYTELVVNILFYAGVVIRDPQIVQIASQKIQQEEVNEKS